MVLIGILGFGKLGKYLYENITKSSDVTVAFVWNRSSDILHKAIPEHLILKNLSELENRPCDLVIEVCHPEVTRQFGKIILNHCHLMLGSPSVLADNATREYIMQIEHTSLSHKIFIPSGAMWGVEDLRKLESTGSVKSLKITMEKYPDSIKLTDEVYSSICEASKSENTERTIFEGSVEKLCQIAPNNTNTMAVAALVCPSLGFQNVVGCLKSNPRNMVSHFITIEMETFGGLSVVTRRDNPAKVGDVTGSATLASFMASVQRACERIGEDEGRKSKTSRLNGTHKLEFC